MIPGSPRARLRALMVQRLLDDATAVLEEAGLASMALKGAHFQRWLYDDPSLRVCGDLDLLVLDHPAAVRALAALGFVDEKPLRHASTLISRRYPIALDLHRSLGSYGLYRLEPRPIFDRGSAIDGARHARKMHPHDAFAHAVGHFASSRFDARFDTIVGDLEVLAARDDFDPRAVADHLQKTGTQRAALHTLLVFEGRLSPPLQELLRILSKDRLGRGLARITSRLLPLEFETKRTALLAHVLDGDLFHGARTATAHAAGGLRNALRGRAGSEGV